MSAITGYDAIVVGSGPNGLAAAVTLARAGRAVLVREAAPTLGGGTRTEELTLPGFRHDVCSAVHPMALASPFFKSLPLAEHGLRWIHGAAEIAHPFDDGTAVILRRSIADTARGLGADGAAWSSLMAPFARRFDDILADSLRPIVRMPSNPFLMARFGLQALRSAESLARGRFGGARARALFAGIAAHASIPLDSTASASMGLVLGLAGHVGGWPIPAGGAQSIADALTSLLKAHGGRVEVGNPVRSLAELEGARQILLDVTPRQLVALAGDRLPANYRRRLEDYRYGPSVFKLDWALSAPIPWTARACADAPTVHLGSTLEEMVESERAASAGRVAARPYVLLSQPTLFDPTRAPAGKHVAWAYCHVPHGCTVDMTAAIEAQVERFAPGFRDLVLGRSALSPARMEAKNANLIGGDISGGSVLFRQILARPMLKANPYRTALPGVYLCSSSTPPGPGVHGMCGHLAARTALADLG